MAPRNPNWTRDELILVLDLYIRHMGNPPHKESILIHDLSIYLNRMASREGNLSENYRNRNGVYMKLMNFRRFDPAFVSQGRSGLKRGSKLDEAVWAEFAGEPDKLRKAASAIIAAVERPVMASVEHSEYDAVNREEAYYEDGEEEAEEGRILTRAHRTRERNRKLRDRKRTEALEQQGHLRCEACGFDFRATYGERGDGVIDIHHTVPVSELQPKTPTKLSDLALLCSNCHRIVHARRPWLSMTELRALLGRR